MSTITIATVCNRLVTYRFTTNDEGKWKAIEEMQDSSNLNLRSIATNFSLDKESLICCEGDEDDSKKINIALHSLTDLKCFYLFILKNIPNCENCWDPASLGQICDLLV